MNEKSEQPTEQSITVTFEIGCITGRIDFTIQPPLTGKTLDSLLDEIRKEIEENKKERSMWRENNRTHD